MIDNAVSTAVGVGIMMAISVALAGGVAIFATNSVEDIDVFPIAVLSAEVVDNEIWLNHISGQAINLEKTEIYVDDELRATNTKYLKAGDRIDIGGGNLENT